MELIVANGRYLFVLPAQRAGKKRKGREQFLIEMFPGGALQALQGLPVWNHFVYISSLLLSK